MRLCIKLEKLYSTHGGRSYDASTRPQIHLWPRVILTFDLLTSKVDRFMPLQVATWTTCVNWRSFPQQRVDEFGNRRTDGRTNGRTGKLRS